MEWRGSDSSLAIDCLKETLEVTVVLQPSLSGVRGGGLVSAEAHVMMSCSPTLSGQAFCRSLGNPWLDHLLALRALLRPLGATTRDSGRQRAREDSNDTMRCYDLSTGFQNFRTREAAKTSERGDLSGRGEAGDSMEGGAEGLEAELLDFNEEYPAPPLITTRQGPYQAAKKRAMDAVRVAEQQILGEDQNISHYATQAEPYRQGTIKGRALG